MPHAATNRLKDLLKKLRDAALTGSQDMPSIDELAAAAADVPFAEGAAAIDDVFEPIDNLIMLGAESAQQVNARRYLRDSLYPGAR